MSFREHQNKDLGDIKRTVYGYPNESQLTCTDSCKVI